MQECFDIPAFLLCGCLCDAGTQTAGKYNKIFEKMIDRRILLCYSEECYIMARCAFLSFDRKDHVIINFKKKQG